MEETPSEIDEIVALHTATIRLINGAIIALLDRVEALEKAAQSKLN